MKAFIHDFNGQPAQQITLPEAGRLSVGKAMDENSRHPGKLDYFRVYNADMATAARFRAVYGEEPKELEVTFLTSDPMQVCKTQYELRCGSVKFAYGDGQTFMYWHVDDWSQPDRKGRMLERVVSSEQEQQQFMQEVEEAAKKVGQFKKLRPGSMAQIGWKMRLTLNLWLPGIGVPGTWVFSTGGKATSIKKIVGVFRTVLLAKKTVQFMPFKLRVKLVKGDTMERKQYPMVELIPPSAEVMEVASKYGGQLFEEMFGKVGEGLMEERILAAAARLELQAGTGVNYNAQPVQEPVGDPDALTASMADSYFAGQEGAAESATEPANDQHPTDLPEDKAEPGSFAYCLGRIRRAGTWGMLAERWDEAKEFHAQAAMRQAYAIRAAQLAPTARAIYTLVDTYTELHGNESFTSAVRARVQAKKWKRPEDMPPPNSK